jgi:hypothetical protein
LRPQDLIFLGSELKHEIGGESLAVTSYLFIQPLDGDVIKFGEVVIEDDPVVTEDQDPRFYGYGERCRTFWHEVSELRCLL